MTRIKIILAAMLVAVALPAAAQQGEPLRPVKTQWLDYHSTSLNATDRTGEFIRHLRLMCTTACYVAISSSQEISADATSAASAESTTSFSLPANVPMLVLAPGLAIVSAIQESSGGILFITEMSR